MKKSILDLDEIKYSLTNNSYQKTDHSTNKSYTVYDPVKYRWSHGAEDTYLGDGLLVYTLVHFFKAKTCVCLGSGGGFVPRIMTQARIDLYHAGIFKGTPSMEWGDIGTTILVDASNGVNGYIDYKEQDSFFRQFFTPNFLNYTTERAYYDYFVKEDIYIDYLHIDADHTYEGVKKDFELYSKRMSPQGIISIHDTDPDYSRSHILHEGGHSIEGVPKFIQELEKENEWEIFNFFNYGIMRDRPSSSGFTVLRRK